MVELLTQLQQDYPRLSFNAGNRFCWSPSQQAIIYKHNASGQVASFSLLHETAHGILGHKHYGMDFELITLEVDAWECARDIAKTYRITIDDDHIQDCLDTYRDWLYRRSICPSCSTKNLQIDAKPTYRCYNCQTIWKVANSRFCRPYRKLHQTQTEVLPVTTLGLR